jgi:hypothetical protein
MRDFRINSRIHFCFNAANRVMDKRPAHEQSGPRPVRRQVIPGQFRARGPRLRERAVAA